MLDTELYFDRHEGNVEHQYITEVERRASKWKDKYRSRHNTWERWPRTEHTGSTRESLSSVKDLNVIIDKIYQRLADLVASRYSDSPDEALEEQISIHFRRLRELQKQEADRIRMATDTFLSGPIGDGLDILKHADEIRAKYGNTSSPDVPSQNSDATKT